MVEDQDAQDEIDDVLDVITEFYGVRLIDLVSRRQSPNLYKARCMGMYLAWKAGAHPLEIGRRFGGRDELIVGAMCRSTARRAVFNTRERGLIRDLQRKRIEASRKRDLPAALRLH